MVHSLSLLALPSLVSQSGWAWLVTGAHFPVSICQSEPPYPGVGQFMEGSSLLPLLGDLSITGRDQSEALVFPQVSWHVVIPFPAPGKGWAVREQSSLSQDDWQPLTQSRTGAFAISPYFSPDSPLPPSSLLRLVSSLSGGQVLISTGARGGKGTVCGAHFVAQDFFWTDGTTLGSGISQIFATH